MYPEEKLAARTLLRHKLSPPYDLKQLAEKYGDVEHVLFPFKADGVTVGIGSAIRPSILVNTDSPPTRRKFTLAHELGHIIIPWHTGTIVSHLEGDKDDYGFEYERMEQEANRFAAELLMPSSWIRDCYIEEADFSTFINRIVKESGASKDAVFIKVFSTILDPIVCARIDSAGYAEAKYRTSSASYPSALDHYSVFDRVIFHAQHTYHQFSLGEHTYVAWVFIGDEIEEVDERSWREIISQILKDFDMEGKLGSVNATMAAAFRKVDHLDEKHACSSVLRSFSVKEELCDLVEHPHFEQYVIKRVKEMFERDRQKK